MSRIGFLVNGAASCVALLAACLAGAPAAEAREPQTTEVRVRIGDLDLSRPEGVNTVLHRFRKASATVCGPYPTPMFIMQARRHAECRNTAMADAVRQVNHPNVTAAYEYSYMRSALIASIQ